MTEETRNARLARICVERSSAQDLAAILAMLDGDAEYRSTRVGNHRGRDAIGAMMGGFFAGYPGVAWPTFAWTTALGILPVTVLMVLAGANIDVMGWRTWLLVAGAVSLLCLVLRAKFISRAESGRDET